MTITVTHAYADRTDRSEYTKEEKFSRTIKKLIDITQKKGKNYRILNQKTHCDVITLGRSQAFLI